MLQRQRILLVTDGEFCLWPQIGGEKLRVGLEHHVDE